MSDQFKEMCIASEELKKLWKPKIGDNYYFKTKEDIIDSEYETVVLDILYVYQLLNAKEAFWRPTQEDLQEIVFKHLAEKEIEDDFELMEYSIQDYFELFGYEHLFDKFALWWDGTRKQANFNELWLAFFEEICFNKCWNAENNKWELMGD